ncbi:MAG: hypothetical protein JSV42_17725 [Chloroflexota bacterium]|nr:MAG: hypothetical protein JSV42_17725 [Chloroflexota bacterium]
MKRNLLIVGALGIAVLTLGLAGLAFAQSETQPPFQDPAFGPGMMGGWRGFGGMHGNWSEGQEGPYHDLMIEAFAEALGLSPEEVQNRHNSGEMMWQIAQSEGFSSAEFNALMLKARSEMLSKAVEDGLLTQEQADYMQNRMQGGGYGSGYGGCGGYGFQSGFHGGHHGWWNSP